MNPQDPLAALHPLRTPEIIGWWPPAPGWWVLLVTVILVSILIACLARRRYIRNAYRRQALRQLERAQQAFQENGDASHYLGQINMLLKSVALIAYPRGEVASTHGGHWREFLNRSLPQAMQLQSTFDNAAYQKSCPDLDVDQVHRAAQLWIKQHKAAR
jgi:hypothetical protein